MIRYTEYDEKKKNYFIKTEREPWTLDYWDLINIIGHLEDELEKLENIGDKLS